MNFRPEAARENMWIVGPSSWMETVAAEPPDAIVSCDRVQRGPYTGLGGVLRALVPDAHRDHPDLTARHKIEILSIAPELVPRLGAPPETLTTLASPEERTRFYSPERTKRLAHGIVEFLHAYAESRGRPLILCFANADAADPTDQEFLEILLRRGNPERVRVVVGTTAAGDLPDGLTGRLRERAVRLESSPGAGRNAPDGRTADARLRAYVLADGRSDSPSQRAAYEAAPADQRSALHDERAVELERRGEPSLLLGAVPYHRERGGDPTGAGYQSLVWAVNYCLRMGFYHAVLDLTMRARALLDPDRDSRSYSHVSTKATTALAMLGRPQDAEEIYLELRERYSTPFVHLFSSYALGMIYTRYHRTEHKNHRLAKAHLNTAIAIARQMDDLSDRAFLTVFHQNGLALAEMHLGNLETALRLVNDGITQLDRELPGDKHPLHRSVLVHNRGQLHAAQGDLDAALSDYNTVIRLDPNHPEYYLDRGSVHRKQGDHAAALRDYEKAMELSPPFPEVYYNRADLYAATGDDATALADYSYVLELDPEYLDARINRVGMLLDAGDLDAASTDIDEGLAHHPGNPHLLCLRGLVAMEYGNRHLARECFTGALDAGPATYEALAGLATLHFEDGDLDAAIDALDQALELTDEHADLLYNRGRAYAAAGRSAEAIADYTNALELPAADRAELLYRRALSYTAIDHDERARDDFLEHLAIGSSPYHDEVQAWLAAGAGGRPTREERTHA